MSRRKLRAREVARQDQQLAAASALGATDPRALVIATSFPESEVQCCWCDCPGALNDPEAPHAQPGYTCDPPCPGTAVYVVDVFKGTPGELRHPVCERHYFDCLNDYRLVFNVPVQYIVAPILDEEVSA